MAKEKKEVVESTENLTKTQALEKARLEIEKAFGKNSLIKLDGSNVEKIPMRSSGILGLDEIAGGGPVGIGRITEIFGPESSGKTTIALHAIAETQRQGGIVAFIDAEHAFDPLYAKNLGINIDNLWFSQPDSGEQGLNIAETLIDSKAMDLIVIDSVNALTPQAEIDGDIGDSHMGLQARLMSQALRKITVKAGKAGTSLIFISQLRSKIGIVFGNPEVAGSGNALKFYASQRIDVRKVETKEDNNEEAIANKIRIKIVKNKLAPPFRKREFMIYFGKGIDKYEDTISLAVEKEIIQKAGSWYSFKEEKIGQGIDNAVKLLKENNSLYNEIETLVKEKIK
jgi:recombination protein RecA